MGILSFVQDVLTPKIYMGQSLNLDAADKFKMDVRRKKPRKKAAAGKSWRCVLGTQHLIQN